MSDLCVMAEQCGTDKHDAKHRYTPIYETLWGGLRGKPITLLEIGVKEGASLRMWEQYFPQAQIHGVDISPEVALAFAGDRASVWVGDQTDKDFLSSVVAEAGPLDIVVDDGSHKTPDQLISMDALWPHVKPGGWYAIEDLSACYMEHYGGGLGKYDTAIERVKRLMDEMNSRVTHCADPIPESVMGDEVAGVHYYGTLVIFQKRGREAHNQKEAV